MNPAPREPAPRCGTCAHWAAHPPPRGRVPDPAWRGFGTCLLNGVHCPHYHAPCRFVPARHQSRATP